MPDNRLPGERGQQETTSIPDKSLTLEVIKLLEGQLNSFSWLHLSDLHVGMKAQDWLWPNVREIFFEDLKRLHDKSGPWDLVVFTGDLTQKGSAEEFRKVDELLGQLWAFFDRLGSSPKLLPVPGNHDLVRPHREDPTIILLQEWIDQSEVQETFWEDAYSPFRQSVTQAFENYLEWLKRTPFTVERLQHGMLPGDFSVTIKKDYGAKLGIVGLNTSFLQLTDKDYKGKLALHPRQFHEACGGDGPVWAKQHHACLLLTHHPPEWLNPISQELLHRDITSLGRFAVHLCGHNHATTVREIAEGGTEIRRIWQEKSLFGLEYFGKENKEQRLHGYTTGRIELAGNVGSLLFWPRESRLQGGQRKIVPDYSIALTESQHTSPLQFALHYPYTPSKEPQAESQDSVINQRIQLLPEQEFEYSINLGFTLVKEGKYGEAIENLQRILRLQSNEPDDEVRIHLLLSLAYQLHDKKEKYKQHAIRAFELNPKVAFNNFELYKNRVMVDIEKQKKEAQLETQKAMLSFLTHSLRNTFSGGPQIIEQILRMSQDLWGKQYQKKNIYKVINNIAGLHSIFTSVNSMLDMYKIYTSEPENLMKRWQEDRGESANLDRLFGEVLRQTLSRILFEEQNTGCLKRLSTLQKKSPIKDIRESFLKEILSSEWKSSESFNQMLAWLKKYFYVISIKISSDDIWFNVDGIRFAFLMACISEIIYNALKYSDAQELIHIQWVSSDKDFIFTCKNTFDRESREKSGSQKGLGFIHELRRSIEGIELRTNESERERSDESKILMFTTELYIRNELLVGNSL